MKIVEKTDFRSVMIEFRILRGSNLVRFCPIIQELKRFNLPVIEITLLDRMKLFVLFDSVKNHVQVSKKVEALKSDLFRISFVPKRYDSSVFWNDEFA